MGEIIPFPVWIIPFPVWTITFPVLKPILNFILVMEKMLLKSFLIRGPEMAEIIPFPVWIIPFPALKIDFEPFGSNEKHFVKEVF